jgi:hypothetical protein
MVLNNVKYCTHTPNALYIGEVLFFLLLLLSQLSLLIAKLIANYFVFVDYEQNLKEDQYRKEAENKWCV